MGELLGEGASGHIYRARYVGHDAAIGPGRELALKVFKAAHTSDGTPQSELAAGLAVTPHPQLLTPLAAVTGHPHRQMAMALPLLPAGMRPLAAPPSLRSCSRDIYPPQLGLTPGAAQHLLAQVGAAVRHLHQCGVLHGDLYAHNILWDPATGTTVLSDLGAAVLTAELPPAQAH
ncbi:MAG: lipopolysaccharide kinase InaA family protein, partial [Comamonas sp.]